MLKFKDIVPKGTMCLNPDSFHGLCSPVGYASVRSARSSLLGGFLIIYLTIWLDLIKSLPSIKCGDNFKNIIFELVISSLNCSHVKAM